MLTTQNEEIWDDFLKFWLLSNSKYKHLHSNIVSMQNTLPPREEEKKKKKDYPKFQRISVHLFTFLFHFLFSFFFFFFLVIDSFCFSL